MTCRRGPGRRLPGTAAASRMRRWVQTNTYVDNTCRTGPGFCIPQSVCSAEIACIPARRPALPAEEVDKDVRQLSRGLLHHVMTRVQDMADDRRRPWAPDAQHVIVVKLSEVILVTP